MATSEGSTSTGWTDVELEASVRAYDDMLTKINANQKIVKKRYYEDLAEAHGRSAKAFEYRMQNISSVLADMGIDWIPGLPPATNVGSKVEDRIIKLIRDRSYFDDALASPVSKLESLERRVAEILARGQAAKPDGNSAPKRSASSREEFARDPAVVAWVLTAANGTCECCRKPAPFTRAKDQLEYLEVHHVKTLAEGGSDTVHNTIAICPNCHRELHYGIEADRLVDTLYGKVDRLVREG